MTRGLLVAALISAGLTAATAAAQVKPGDPPISAQTMLSGGTRPPDQAKLRLEHVDLAVEVLPDRQAIAGTATLTLRTSGALDRLLIDLDKNLPVSAVAVDGRALRPERWSNAEGQLVIRLPRRLRAGAQVTTRIVYGGTPHVAVRAPWDDGFVWSKTGDGRPWIATTAEGYGCDLFWPCLDFPEGEPQLVDLHVTVPAGLADISGGRLIGKETLPDGRTRWNWRQKSPNPYSVALNIAPYAELAADYRSRFGNIIPLRFWYLPANKSKAEGLFTEFAPTLDFFESLIGPFPFGDEKMAIVETPHLGMEHQTANAYGNNYKKAPEGFDWLFQHELSHEWFGNQLTVANWDDYWLHEGYGEYMQPLYAQWREGEARYAVMMEEQRQKIDARLPVVSGRQRTEEQVYEAADGGPGQDIYYKGSWVLHTLRYAIGDQAFFDATRLIVYGRTDPRPGNFAPRFGSTREFIRDVNQVTGSDYGWFFDVYLYQAALPDLQSSRSGDWLMLQWKVPGDKPFPLPVEIAVDGRIQRIAMPSGRASVAVPAGAHVVLDPMARILKRSQALDDARAWQKANPPK